MKKDDDKNIHVIDISEIGTEFYYDGPIKDSGRTMEEIDADIAREKERMKHLKWPDKYQGV